MAQGALLRYAHPDVLKLFAALLIGKVVVIAAGFLALGTPVFLQTMTLGRDAGWLVTIATQGYTIPNDFAFSPFYPALIRALTIIIGSSWISAFIISNVLSFVFPMIVYKTFGFRTALLAELFPTYLYFTTVAYSEALTMVFLALSILFVLRGRMILSSSAVSLAIFNAYSIAWTLPSFVVAFVKSRGAKSLAFFVVPVLTGILILYWFHLATGSFFSFFDIERTHWNVSFGTPWEQAAYLLGTTKSFVGYWPFPGAWFTRNLPFEAFYVFGAIYILRIKVQERWFLSAYSFLAIAPLFFVIGGPALSIPRLLLPAFPAFVSYASFIKGRYVWVYGATCMIVAVWIVMQQMAFIFA
jgi:hypothetical protein